MAPKLRGKADPAPTYGPNSDEFIVEIHYGGFFVGSGQLKSYLDEQVNWFDHCEVDTWSKLWLEDMLEQLGYSNGQDLKCYWLLPGKEIADGLRIISGDADTNAMCSVVDRIKNLVVYSDYEDAILSAPWDDIVLNPVAELPKVISPVKVHHVAKKPGEKLPDFYKNLSPHKDNDQQSEEPVQEAGIGSEEDSEDSDFVDTDNEVDDGDDDLFVDHVDDDVLAEGMIKKSSKKAKGSRLKGDGDIKTRFGHL